MSLPSCLAQLHIKSIGVAYRKLADRADAEQFAARFRGPDFDSAVAAELVAVAGRINNVIRRLGSG
jgi:hypothetical protein